MAKTELEALYGSYESFLEKARAQNSFYGYFQNAIAASPCQISIYEKYIQRDVDMSWVIAMEEAIVPLDTIIRNPNRYIKREEDIVPIEMARQIGPESVRHLAQHTSMISSVKNGQVTPSRVLNVVKEEALDTYENRFVFTLLQRMEYFLDKRMQVLMKGSKLADIYDYRLEGSVEAGSDRLEYSLSMNLVSPHEELEGGEDALIRADISNLSTLQRVERLRKIIYDFKSSKLIRDLKGCAPVRPPLTMTNVLRKNPNFVKAVELWGFLSRYDDVGYTMESVERQRLPEAKEQKDLNSLILLQYLLMKNNAGRPVLDADLSERRRELTPRLVRRTIEEMTESYDLSVDEVRRVFLCEIEKKEQLRKAQRNKFNAILDRAMTEERKVRAEAERKEKERLRREEIRKKKEAARLERERIKEEKRRAREAEQRRLRAEQEEKKRREEEARRIAAEQEAEKARLKKAEEELEARREAERRAAAELLARLEREEAERRAREEQMERERLENERRAQEERQRQERLEAERRAEEERQARLRADEEARKAWETKQAAPEPEMKKGPAKRLRGLSRRSRKKFRIF